VLLSAEGKDISPFMPPLHQHFDDCDQTVYKSCMCCLLVSMLTII